MTQKELYAELDRVLTFCHHTTKRDVKEVVQTYFASELNYVEQLKAQNGELSAKVYIYEKIIAKSNFAPFIESDVVEGGDDE